jgi:hypothetical protein
MYKIEMDCLSSMYNSSYEGSLCEAITKPESSNYDNQREYSA